MALREALRGWDLQPRHIATCQEVSRTMLIGAGCPAEVAAVLTAQWLSTSDFLLSRTKDRGKVDLVVGNPPYIRIEDISPELLRAYRAACPAMGGRADVYIGFFEHALDLLAPAGQVGFICADRWMRNQYGQRLREKIVRGGYSLDVSLSMHDADAFAERVSAYPAVTIIRAGSSRRPAVGKATAGFDSADAVRFTNWVAGDSDALVADHVTAHRLVTAQTPTSSWAEASPGVTKWLAAIESSFLSLGESGVRVGIGVATGRDAVFVSGACDAPRIEPDRLLPLAKVADLKTGEFRWGGSVLINPWTAEGLVALDRYPRLGAYLRSHEPDLRRRSVGRRSPDGWWRTIDRVNHDLLTQPMLLLADMTAQVEPVLAPPGYYPHPQPVLDDLATLGSTSTWRVAAFEGGRAASRCVLREDARRHSAFPGSIPTAGASARSGKHFPGAAKAPGRGFPQARPCGSHRGSTSCLRTARASLLKARISGGFLAASTDRCGPGRVGDRAALASRRIHRPWASPARSALVGDSRGPSPWS
ncbi:MAG: Eco57I restriction-modification methylase domain-containing protein [Candidatus Nanopelagicales bacterium]